MLFHVLDCVLVDFDGSLAVEKLLSSILNGCVKLIMKGYFIERNFWGLVFPLITLAEDFLVVWNAYLTLILYWIKGSCEFFLSLLIAGTFWGNGTQRSCRGDDWRPGS
jgi:hypothetical protein